MVVCDMVFVTEVESKSIELYKNSGRHTVCTPVPFLLIPLILTGVWRSLCGHQFCVNSNDRVTLLLRTGGT